MDEGNYVPYEGKWITIRNGNRFYNKPLYGDHMPSVLLTGDLPQLKFVHEPSIFGSVLMAYARESQTVWFHLFSERRTYFGPNHTRWELTTTELEGLTLHFEAVPLSGQSGFAMRLEVKGNRPGDRVVWMTGGGHTPDNPSTLWVVDPSQHGDKLTSVGFHSLECLPGTVGVDGQAIRLTPTDQEKHGGLTHSLLGYCSEPSELFVAEAEGWEESRKLIAAAEPKRPVVCGITELTGGVTSICWAFRRQAAHQPQEKTDSWALLYAGLQRADEIRNRVQFETPDENMNAALPMLGAAIDATYYPPVYVHGAMSWNWPYPGWRTLYGPICYGWHANVREEMNYYLASQSKEDPIRIAAASDPEFGHSIQASGSRFYGAGRVVQDQSMYNMQEVLFDQLIAAWRATGDPETQEKLQDALELHLKWMKDCFDPDDDGVYESYINVWASDSIWYNGGGTAQSSAYAYAGHRAAMELAELMHQESLAAFHEQSMQVIKEGVIRSLWIPEKGHLAEYREAAGLKRRHDSACLYTVFLPIDAGLLNWQESLQALHYSEWALERIPLTRGGELCWSSNYVPWTWSVREIDFADHFHLALAYYKAGLGEAGWKLLRGAYLESAYSSIVPGALVCIPIWLSRAQDRATDFADTVSVFTRLIIEGLYGYQPHYAFGKVLFQPQFPEEWKEASVATPDFAIRYSRQSEDERYDFTLTKPAAMTIRIPVSAHRISDVFCNGERTAYTLQAGIGKSVVFIERDVEETSLSIRFRTEGRVAIREEVSGDGQVGQELYLAAEGHILEVIDPQSLMEQYTLHLEAFKGKVRDEKLCLGNHLLLFRLKIGETEQWRQFKLTIHASPTSTATAPDGKEEQGNGFWECVDLTGAFNATICEVYEHRYLSPRPNTCSAQLGEDGYSPWTYYFWKRKAPKIDLERVPELLGNQDTIHSKSGVPFKWGGEASNIAFTSNWDNWPNSIEVPMGGKQGRTIAFLVGGTTNAMQVGIVNGLISLIYEDGEIDVVELIHPINYWSLSEEYDMELDRFALPETIPESIQLGNHCRAMVVTAELRPLSPISTVKLETLSQEIVVGLMGISVC